MNIYKLKNPFLKRHIFSLSFLVGVVVVFVLAGGATFAQSAEERITLSPAVSRPEPASAGSAFTGSLKIINDGTVDYDFTLYSRPFSVKGERYDPNYDEVGARTEAYQWVQFEKTKLHLKAGERVDVGYTITVPQKTASGGHYAVLFAETQPASNSGGSVVRKKRVGSLLYMTVSGEIYESGSLVGIETKKIQTRRPIQADIRIKNEGNVHYRANIRAHYQDLFGSKKFQLNQEALILPETTRRVPMIWEKPPYLGVFRTGGTIEFLGKTEVLPQKYIVFMPTSLMVVLIGAVAIFVVYTVVKRKFYAKTSKSDKSAKK